MTTVISRDKPAVITPPTPPAPPAESSGSPQPPAKPRNLKPKQRYKLRDILLFLALAGPNIALLIIFVYRPLVMSLQYSTLQWNVGSSVARFVGLDNYIAWLTHPTTPTVVANTLIYAVATVFGSLALGLGLALLLNMKLRGRGIARTVAFAPYVLSGIAVGMVWLYIFDPRYGLLSVVLGWFGLDSPQWYTTNPAALWMIIIVSLWKQLGYVALIYLAGLQGISQDVKDAAALDGASKSRTFFSIVLPLLGPTTFFLLITSTLASLQSFDFIKAMTDGGPLGGTTTIMYQIYVEGFQTGRAGYASAVATVLFAVLLVITAIQMKYMERKVHFN